MSLIAGARVLVFCDTNCMGLHGLAWAEAGDNHGDKKGNEEKAK